MTFPRAVRTRDPLSAKGFSVTAGYDVEIDRYTDIGDSTLAGRPCLPILRALSD